jgi:hypothetical protein
LGAGFDGGAGESGEFEGGFGTAVGTVATNATRIVGGIETEEMRERRQNERDSRDVKERAARELFSALTGWDNICRAYGAPENRLKALPAQIKGTENALRLSWA